MLTAANSNLLVTEFSSLSRSGFTQVEVRQEGFYQQFASKLARRINSRQVFENLAQRLIAIADRAYVIRRMEVVEQASRMLMNLPLPRHYESVCQYYIALCLGRQRKFADAGLLLEQIVEETPSQHRPKVIISLAGSYFDRGNFQSALPLYIEAGKASLDGNRPDICTAIHSQKMIAVLKSIDGNHQGALDDLEKLFPLAHSVSRSNGPLFCDFLNSYAVELTEVGRLPEALNVIRIVLASPFASAYPEWRETGEDIRRRGRRPYRSIAVFTQRTLKPNNLAFLPNRDEERKWTPNPFQQSAPVVNLKTWKDEMGKKSNGDKKDSKPVDQMSQDEILFRIVHIFTDPNTSEEKRREMIEAIEEIAARPDKKSDED